MALVLRIKFPPTYPLIYKTLRIDGKLTVTESIRFIGESLNVPINGDIGLYIPQRREWLDNDTPLSNYREQLEDVEEVEFKDRKEKEKSKLVQESNKAASGGGGCCLVA